MAPAAYPFQLDFGSGMPDRLACPLLTMARFDQRITVLLDALG